MHACYLNTHLSSPNAIGMRQMPGLCEPERIYDRSLRIRPPEAIEMPGEYEGMEYTVEVLQSHDSTIHKMPAYGGRSRSVSSQIPSQRSGIHSKKLY